MFVPGDLARLTQAIGMIDGPIPGGPVIAVGPGRPGRPPKYVLPAGTALRIMTFETRDASISAVAEGVSKQTIMGVPISILEMQQPGADREAVVRRHREAEARALLPVARPRSRRTKPKPTRGIPQECVVVSVRERAKLARYGMDRESAEGGGEELFDLVGIHTADDEKTAFVAICGGGAIVGAITFAPRDGQATFSVAVDPDWQRKNLGRRLVEAVLEKHDGDYYVQVINPNMAKLLEDLGFEAESRGGWSHESPMMKL